MKDSYRTTICCISTKFQQFKKRQIFSSTLKKIVITSYWDSLYQRPLQDFTVVFPEFNRNLYRNMTFNMTFVNVMLLSRFLLICNGPIWISYGIAIIDVAKFLCVYPQNIHELISFKLTNIQHIYQLNWQCVYNVHTWK